MPLEIGKGRIVREGNSVAILSLGTRLAEALKAAEDLGQQGLSVTVADARFAKPFDEDLIRDLAKSHEIFITVEEGSGGGFGAHVLEFMAQDRLLENGLKVRTLTLPDRFIDQDSPAAMYDEAGLNAPEIVEAVREMLGVSEAVGTRPKRA